MRRGADGVSVVARVVASLRDSGFWLAFVSRHCRAGLQIVASLRDSGFFVAYLRGMRVFAIVRRVLLVGVMACAALAWRSCAWAQDAGLDVSQYAHTAWRVSDGFTKGSIFAMAQTPDGYLWLGTESGLVRFDGVRAVPWQPPAGEQLPSEIIRGLLVSRDGALWISTQKGLASWKDGKLTQYPEVAGQMIQSLLQDRQGTIWFGTYGPGKLCAVQDGKVQCYGAGNFGVGVFALYQDGKGNLWLEAQTGLWRWLPGPPQRYAFPRGVLEAKPAGEDASGALLLTGSDGLKELAEGRIQSYVLPGLTGKIRSRSLLRSRDGSLWFGAADGLWHWHDGRMDTFGAPDGLSGDSAVGMFEDREGSVWVRTNGGLDRFREYAFPRISRNQGLSNSDTASVQATPDGSIWIGMTDGLNRWKSGHVTVYVKRSGATRDRERHEREPSTASNATEVSNNGLVGIPHSLGLDYQGRLWTVTSEGVFYLEDGRFVRVPEIPLGAVLSLVADGRGKMWVSNSDRGLFHLAPGEDVEPMPWARFGQRYARPRALLPDRSQGGLWIGFSEGGVAYLQDDQVRVSYSAADGLGNGAVNDLRFGPRGALWVATESGLSRVKEGRITTLTSKNGLPCDTVHWTMEDDDHFQWVYMPCGLVRIARSELDAWVSDPKRTVQTKVFDAADGVRTTGYYGGYGPHVTKSPDGRIWYATVEGVQVIDPRHLAYNKVPPPVQIEQITADGKTYDASSSNEKGGLRLPPLVRNLAIDYTALSLAVPEKVHFRFKLEGQDKYWREVVNDREVQYSNLAPKKYRFRVMACNNSGVWNEEGAAVEFSIAPAYYQTNWFRALCVAAFLALLWALYQYRLHQIQRQLEIGFEARMSERLRIARELHDTLLQTFQGLLLRFQAAANFLPNRPEEAKEKLESAMDLGSQAIAEGREAVQGLRASTTVTNELAVALSALAKELGGNEPSENAPVIRVVVEGEPCDLHPLLRDEVYRIAGEAMRNAVRHGQATRIEVEIHYDAGQLRLRIRDDGKGIGREVIEGDGRTGHWGLHGMRERARIIGGKLEVWSRAGQGTEVELKIPARAAYARADRLRKEGIAKS